MINANCAFFFVNFDIAGASLKRIPHSAANHHSSGRSSHTEVTHPEAIVEKSSSVLVFTGLSACVCVIVVSHFFLTAFLLSRRFHEEELVKQDILLRSSLVFP